MADIPPPPRVVILHGWENRRPPAHWEHWLFDRLTEQGWDADYPALPDPDEPDLETWRGILTDLIGRGDRPVTLVAHSLAASLWLQHLSVGGTTGLVTRLALVAIPSPVVLEPTVVAPFVAHEPRIDALAGIEQIVFEGEGDPYSPGGLRAAYTLDPAIPVEFVELGGHLTPDTGFGPWPRILDWTRGLAS